MSLLKNLVRPTGTSIGGGGGIKSEVILIHEDDILTFPERDVDEPGQITTDIILKAGAKAHKIYFTEKTIVPKMELVKGENADCGGYKCSLEGFHPGCEKEVLSFIAKNAFNFKGIALIRNCAEKKVVLMGEPCNNLSFSGTAFEWGATSENKKGTTFTMESVQSMPMAIYSGTLPALEGDETQASGAGI